MVYGVKKALLGSCGVVVLKLMVRKLGCSRGTPRTNTQTMEEIAKEEKEKCVKIVLAVVPVGRAVVPVGQKLGDQISIWAGILPENLQN